MTDSVQAAVAAPPVRRRTLQAIQCARGVAAILVVLYHGGRMLSLPQYVGYVPLRGIFAFGHAGVDFFFVLSGFIITYVHHADIGRPSRLAHYARQRLTRIYPIYWVATAIVIATILVSHDPWAQLRPPHVVASLLLIPHGQEPVLSVAWTLEHEMLFYLAFGVAILSRRLGQALLIGCLLLVALVTVDPSFGAAVSFLGSFYHLQFLMGIAAAALVLRGNLRAPRVLACAGIGAFLAAGIVEDVGLVTPGGTLSMLLFGIASALAISGLAAAEQRGMLTIGRFGVLLGAASYAIYLIHVPVIGHSAWVAARLGVIKLPPGWVVLLVAACLATTAACLLHLFVEKPLLDAIRRRLPHAPQRAVPRTVRQVAPLP
jgi:exopolysaccharide production protein ExoZ